MRIDCQWPPLDSNEQPSHYECAAKSCLTLVQMSKAGNRRFAASFEMSMVV
jgi:hypothetical protein